jgi:class 3 adenylate cyclase/tetratricopeptide (TPR) repeat protein
MVGEGRFDGPRPADYARPMTCPACGAENRAGARFCDACGAALPKEASREVRKVVTVLFCDVIGSTALGERVDPETLRSTMTRYYAVARAAIERHGGTVEKFIGDAVMAVFGVPTVREDDALRAVRAALELRDSAEVGIRIGVNTGEVVTGTGETLVTGDAVNVAARLEQAASPGEVLIGESTYALVRDAVDAELLPPVDAKGKSAPVTAYQLRGVTGGTAYVRRTDVSFVGREHEQQLLESAWARAQSERACVLFTVLGTAGVGKSRLIAEFTAKLGATVLAGRCLSYGDGITYWPAVEVVKQLLGQEPAPNPAIASLLGHGNVTAEEIAISVRRLLEARARERPVVVVFDDLQWAEPTFLDLVEHVADWSRDAPMLVVCLARPELLELRAGWGGGKLNATTVLLEPLDEGESGELIDALLGTAGLDDELRARITSAAEGNPLFVEQMLAMVQDAPGGEVSVPPTIQALLAARLDQLPGGERGALERGAVEGQVFHGGAVQALAPAEPVPQQLMGLIRKELVRPTTPTLPGDDAFRFRHLLIRDAAYDALPKSIRAELHGRFADWLAVAGAGLVELDEVLGYHLEQAARYRVELGEASGDLGARAADRLISAGTRAVMRGDYGAGKNLLRRAIELLPPGSRDRYRALPWLGIATFAGGGIEEADAIWTEAVEHGGLEESSIAFFRRSMTRAQNGTEPFDTLAQGIRDRLDEIGPRLSTLALADGHFALGRTMFWSGGTAEILDVARAARQEAREAGHVVVEAQAAGLVGTAMIYGPSPWEELEAFARSTLDERDRLGGLAADGVAALAFAAAFQGRFSESEELFAQHAAEIQERGSHWEAALSSSAQDSGFSALLAGNPARAESLLRHDWIRLGEIGERGFRSTTGCLLAIALAELGRDVEAEELAAEAEALTTEDDWLTYAFGAGARAVVARHRGHHDEAVAQASRALDLALPTEYVVLHPWYHLELARALLAAGRSGEAERALQESVRSAKRKGSTVFVDAARALGWSDQFQEEPT